MKTGISRLVLATAAVGLLAPAAFGQSAGNPFLRGRHVPVGERPQPGFDPEPKRVGAFMLNSSLTASVEHNSNVLATPANEVDDVLVRLIPQVDLSSNWSRHYLSVGGQVNHREYQEEDNETATDYSAYLRGGVDVIRSLRINGALSTARITEPRYELASQNLGGEPVRYDVERAEISGIFQRDRYQVSAGIGVQETEFDRVDQEFRNVNEVFYTTRGSLAVSPDLAVFVEGRLAALDYFQVGADNRDATRADIRAGVNFELQAPFRGEFSVGHTEEDKDDDLRADTSGLSVNGRLLWMPTQLTTVTFNANRSIFDPGLPNIATAFDTWGGVRVDHELLRNLLLFGEATVGKIEFEDAPAGQEDVNRLDLRIGAGYRVNRHVRLDLSLSHYNRDGYAFVAGDPDEMDQNIVGLSLRLTP